MGSSRVVGAHRWGPMQGDQGMLPGGGELPTTTRLVSLESGLEARSPLHCAPLYKGFWLTFLTWPH